MKFFNLSLLIFALASTSQANVCANLFSGSSKTGAEKREFLSSEAERAVRSWNEHKHKDWLFSGTEKVWVAQAKEVKSESEGLSVLKQIIESSSFLSFDSWKLLVEASIPPLLYRLETLDNLGLAELANVKKYIDAQLVRTSEFNDSKYFKVLEGMFVKTKPDSHYYGATYRLNILNEVNSRNGNPLIFKRTLKGSEAEMLYLAMRLPESNRGNGVYQKLMRSTDRSYQIVLTYDSKSNSYQANFEIDSKSPRFIVTENGYSFKATRNYEDYDAYVLLGSGRILYDALNVQSKPLAFEESVKSLSVNYGRGKLSVGIAVTAGNIRTVGSDGYSNRGLLMQNPEIIIHFSEVANSSKKENSAEQAGVNKPEVQGGSAFGYMLRERNARIKAEDESFWWNFFHPFGR